MDRSPTLSHTSTSRSLRKLLSKSNSTLTHPSRLDTPPSRRLPRELVLQILRHLLASTHEWAYTIPIGTLAFTDSLATTATRQIARCQQNLHWASRVCRNWHAVGSELLYTSPFLTSHRQLQLFARTLSETPYLAQFVKDVYAPISNQGTVSNVLSWMWGTQSTKSQRGALISLLRNCPSLESLTIRHSVRKNLASMTPIDDILQGASIGGSIKRLTIHGSSFETRWRPQFCIMPALDNVLMPSLEVLCLRGAYILPTFQLPVLPRLHTLQLVDNYFFPSTGERGPLFTHDKLPSLKRVEVYKNHFPEAQAGYMLDKPTLAKLDCLHIIDTEPHLTPTRWMPPDGDIKHLALGVLNGRDHTDLVCWRIPDRVENLTLFLRQVDRPIMEEKPRDGAEEILDGVLRCIELNKDAQALRRLALVADFAPLADQSRAPTYRRVLKDIQKTCKSRRISISFKLGVADAWVTEHLAGTHPCAHAG